MTVDMTARAARLPEPGESVRAIDFTMGPAGKGAHQAIMSARMGAPTALVGARGDDQPGELVCTTLARENIDPNNLRVVGLGTGIGHIQTDAHGLNRVISVARANSALTPEIVLDHRALINAAAVVVGQLVVPLDATMAAFSLAASCGAITILNPAPASDLDDSLYRLVDVLIPNETEAASLTGVDTITLKGAVSAARALLKRGPALVVITLGARGALAVTKHRALEVGAYCVDSVDSTAAGDAFCGAFAAAVALDMGLKSALTLASAAGALATTRLGGVASLATREEISRLVRSDPLVITELH